jgi:hypothetical protein
MHTATSKVENSARVSSVHVLTDHREAPFLLFRVERRSAEGDLTLVLAGGTQVHILKHLQSRLQNGFPSSLTIGPNKLERLSMTSHSCLV